MPDGAALLPTRTALLRCCAFAGVRPAAGLAAVLAAVLPPADLADADFVFVFEAPVVVPAFDLAVEPRDGDGLAAARPVVVLPDGLAGALRPDVAGDDVAARDAFAAIFAPVFATVFAPVFAPVFATVFAPVFAPLFVTLPETVGLPVFVIGRPSFAAVAVLEPVLRAAGLAVPAVFVGPDLESFDGRLDGSFGGELGAAFDDDFADAFTAVAFTADFFTAAIFTADAFRIVFFAAGLATRRAGGRAAIGWLRMSPLSLSLMAKHSSCHSGSGLPSVRPRRHRRAISTHECGSGSRSAKPAARSGWCRTATKKASLARAAVCSELLPTRHKTPRSSAITRSSASCQ